MTDNSPYTTLTTKSYNFASQYLNKELKPTPQADYGSQRIRRHELETKGGAAAMMDAELDPVYRYILADKGLLHTGGGIEDLLNRKGPFTESAIALEGLTQLACKAVIKRRLEISSGTNVFAKLAVDMFAGGLQNALHTHIGLARTAYIKLKGICQKTGEKIDDLLDGLLANNKHCSTEMTKLHVAVMQLIETLNGIAANQSNTYDFKPVNFDIAKCGDQLYLLPTMDFLDRVIRAAKNPATKIKLQRHEGLIEVPFALAHIGPLLGCPVAHHCKTPRGEEVDLLGAFFKKIDPIIKAVANPTPENRAAMYAAHTH